MRSFVRCAASLLLVASVATCSDSLSAPGGRSTGAPPVVEVVYAGPDVVATHLAISPTGGTFGSLTPVQFTAQALDASNAVVPNVPIIWSTNNTAIATINASGAL